MTWTFKDPDEVLDYQVDWATALGTDTIATSTFVVPAGITKDSETSDTTTATVWLSAGTDGTRYDIKNTIATAGGRTFERNISVFVRAKAVTGVLDATVGGVSADSYVTEVEYLDYALDRGWTVETGQEANLRKARQYIDHAYVWRGYRVDSAQSLEWPRYISGYIDGHLVASDTIPQAIKDAQCEVAQLIASGADPFATIENGAVIRKREKVDVIEEDTTYADASRERIAFPLVDGMVAPYAEMKRGAVPASIMLARA